MIESFLEAAASLGWFQISALWLSLIFAALIRAFTGFGFSLAAMPALSLFMSPVEAVVLVAMLAVMVGLITLRKFWGVAPLKPIVPLVLFSLVGTVLGAMALELFSPSQFQLWIGVLVIAACGILRFFHPKPRDVGLFPRAATGLTSGLMNGAFSIPGPPMIVFALATEPDPARSRSLLMVFFLASSLLALASYAALGHVTRQSVNVFVIAAPAILIGDVIGHRLFVRFGDKLYRTIALIVLFGAGVTTILKALVGS